MAKVTGIVKLTGTIDGMNFYIRKGVAVCRTAGGGYNGKHIRTRPEYARTRENGSEWKLCMKSVQVFKEGLQPYFHYVKDGDSHQRLIGLFSQIKAADVTSVRGERFVGGGLQTVEGRKMLKGFVFSPGAGLNQVFPGTCTFSWEGGLSISAVSQEWVVFPTGATHLELTALFYVFDFEAYSWVLEKSDPVVIERGATLKENFSLSPNEVPDAAGNKIGLVMYRFMQETNGALYVLKGVGCQGLEAVWVDGI